MASTPPLPRRPPWPSPIKSPWRSAAWAWPGGPITAKPSTTPAPRSSRHWTARPSRTRQLPIPGAAAGTQAPSMQETTRWQSLWTAKNTSAAPRWTSPSKRPPSPLRRWINPLWWGAHSRSWPIPCPGWPMARRWLPRPPWPAPPTWTPWAAIPSPPAERLSPTLATTTRPSPMWTAPCPWRPSPPQAAEVMCPPTPAAPPSPFLYPGTKAPSASAPVCPALPPPWARSTPRKLRMWSGTTGRPAW